MSLALWLRAGRAQKGLSLEDVAKITKIQARILERLEAGKLDGLPAEVFVRGFIRSVAKCVGLDESEALSRYSAAQGSPTSVPTATASAVAFVESMSDLAPSTSSLLAPVVLVSPPSSFAAASNQGLPAITDQLDDVEIHVDIDTAPVAPIERAVLEVAPEAAAAIVEAAAPIEVVEAPIVEAPIVEAAPAPATNGKKKRQRKPRGTNAGKGKRKAMATGTPSSAMPVVEAAIVVETSVGEAAPVVDAAPVVEKRVVETPLVEATEAAPVVDAAPVVETPVVETPVVEAPVVETTAAEDLFGAATATSVDPSELVSESTDETATSGTWKPSMPAVTSSVPWRRPALGIYATSTAPVVPTLVIDDADPESAASEQEDRAHANVPRRSFLPPILAERAKQGASGQGTLTLAVIILLIAATLTLSYLMRRPSSSGDGVTRADGAVELVG